MAKISRTFRTSESLLAETKSRAAVAPFLTSRGYRVDDDHRKETGTAVSQVVAATTPDGKQIKMRVRLCWRWGDGRGNRTSAAQLRARLIDNDWNKTFAKIVERDSDEIVWAALIPINQLIAIWKK